MSNASKPLVIAISSRALFSIEDGHQIFENEGQDAFDRYMIEKQDVPLKPGSAFSLVKKLLALNTTKFPERRDKFNIVILSRNSPMAGGRIMNSVHHYGLDIESVVFSSGGDRFKLAKAFDVDLFLSANESDVVKALKHGVCAARIIPKEQADFCIVPDSNTVRIAFDFDAVLGDDSSDKYYREHGLAAFREHELQHINTPIGEGPMKNLLMRLVDLKKTFPEAACPLILTLITARGMPSHGRVLKTLNEWGARFDEAIFAGGHAKGGLLAALGTDFLADDTLKNIDSAEANDVLGGHVPNGEGGIVAH